MKLHILIVLGYEGISGSLKEKHSILEEILEVLFCSAVINYIRLFFGFVLEFLASHPSPVFKQHTLKDARKGFIQTLEGTQET